MLTVESATGSSPYPEVTLPSPTAGRPTAGVQSQTGHYPDGDDVAGAVDHREAGVHEHLPQELDVALVLAAQCLALGALQHAHGLQGPRQQHGRQRGGKDEASRVGPHGVDQRARAGDVPAHAAKGFACGRQPRYDSDSPLKGHRK